MLKVEDVDFDPDSGLQRELWCLAIASKRYALAVRSADGFPQLVRDGKQAKRSEHGLGHLLPPRDPDPASDDKDWCD